MFSPKAPVSLKSLAQKSLKDLHDSGVDLPFPAQTDLILLDFSKAFDKVAHEKLTQKLHHYGIRGDSLKWIKDFLDNRKQAVVINGVNLNCTSVSSGVPQGSVLGPILFFFVYINDLPEQVKSRVRLFADDTAMHLALSSHTEGQVLQNDLLSLEKWEKI